MAVRYPLMVLVDQRKLSQWEAAEEMGLSVRQVRRLVRRYRESEGQLGSLAYQRQYPGPNALPDRLRQEILRLHQEYPRWSCPAASSGTRSASSGPPQAETPPVAPGWRAAVWCTW